MHISKLTIKNFRSFDSTGVTVDFTDNVTAFIGKNGSGKTSILEALHYLIGNEYLPSKINEKDFHCLANNIKNEILIEASTTTPFFLDVDVISDKGVASTVIIPCNGLKLTIKRREKADRTLDDPYIISKVVTPMLGVIEDSVYQSFDTKRAYKISSIEEVDSSVTNLEEAKEVIRDLLKGQASDLQILDNFYQVQYKLKSSKDIRYASFPSYSLSFNPNKIRGLAKSYYLPINRDDDISGSYSLISKVLTDLHWRYKKKQFEQASPTIESSYNQLADSLRGVIDEKGILIRAINQKLQEICSENKDLRVDFIDIDQPYKAAFLSREETGKLLLPNNLGSGYSVLVAFALFLYVVSLEKIPIVLIIDEPELHLHSDWQRKMYEIFSNQTELQIIYSTQSENFVSLKNWRQIKLINHEILPKQEVLSESLIATDGTSGTRSDCLDDYAQRNLHISCILRENLELFFTKKVILVEGPSEKYAFPKLLLLKDLKVGDYSVTIIPVWGKVKLKIYQTICRCFGVEYFTVYDKDKKDSDESGSENSAIQSNVLGEKYVGFSTSFEKLLGITDDEKFQGLVKYMDNLSGLASVNSEVVESIDKIKSFIES